MTENARIRPIILEDEAYPLLSWLVSPYLFEPALIRQQQKFNKKLSEGRVHVERAFEILKARWRCLLKRLDNEIENILRVVITCCLLHNICQMNKVEYIDDDGILEDLWRQEPEAGQRRGQNHYRNRSGVTVRLCLKVH